MRSRAATAVVTGIIVLLTAFSPVQAGAPAPGEHLGATPIELQISRFYRAVLDREPDPVGLNYWYTLLSTGTPVTTIADSFAISEEFQQRFGVDTGAEGDGDFVRQVYLNVLGRAPDAEGRAYWGELLDSGVPRAQVVLWFSESAEFIARTGLAPPKLAPFTSSITSVSASELGVSWRSGCPVAPANLRLVTVSIVDFEGQRATGEMVVHADVAAEVVVVFERLYESRYPIQSMITIDRFGGSDDASMDANNTSAFNCRQAVGSGGWSRHAFGKAIDINPLVNPYVKGELVLPPSGDTFTDRINVHNPSLIREGDIVVRSFDAVGWFWGGRWRSLKDYQHFSTDNR